jgi:putative transcriptional regulator
MGDFRKRLNVLLLSGGLLAVLLLPALAEQAIQENERTFGIRKGKFLVASKNMQDPDFAEAVVLILRVDERGAIGLIVNHRTSVPVGSIFPGITFKASASMPVYKGGPVRMGVNALVWSNTRPQSASAVLGNVYVIADTEVIRKTVAAASSATRMRVYVGLCGWWPATQLFSEIRRGLWFITDGDPGIVFRSSPETVWPSLAVKLESPGSNIEKK